MSSFLKNLLFLLGVTALFAVAGHPIGATTFSLLGGAGAWLTDQPPGTAGMIFYGGLLALGFSWLVGGLQAALTGAAVALGALWLGRVSVALAMATSAGLAFAWAEDLGPLFSALMVAVHVVPAIACTLIAHSIWGRQAGRSPPS